MFAVVLQELRSPEPCVGSLTTQKGASIAGVTIRKAAQFVPCAGLVALLAASAPPWPDDWDGLGFLAAVRHFDLDRFAPHPPGYPVYVALLKLADVASDPRVAAYAVSIASGVASLLLARDAARRLWGEATGWALGAAVAIPPLAWRASSAIGTEALALAFAMLAVWALTRSRDADPKAGWLVATGLGVAVGLGMGVRLSWGPLYLALLAIAPRGLRQRAVGIAAIAVLAWAAPLCIVVGPAHLFELLRTQAHGHATSWGGTVITDPGMERGLYFARDLFVDGLGVDRDALGLALGMGAVVLLAVGLRRWKQARFAGIRSVAAVLAPYLVWIAFGQNLRQQPRHALPLVVALAAGLARVATSGRRTRALGAALALLVAARTFLDARERRTVAPAGAQLVDYVRSLPDPREVAVFGGTSARFFEPTELADRAWTAGSLGDAEVTLGRMNRLPRRVLVTSELEGFAESRAPLPWIATFCRPARIDRRAPCLSAYEWRLPFLPVTR